MKPRRSPADRDRVARPPLDAAALDRLAIHYVGRYATTRAKLETYLARKLRERGGEGDADPAQAADRMVALGYVDDACFARARAETLARRGYGAARVRMALGAAGIGREAREALAGEIAAGATAAALALARRRRLGPFAAERAVGPGRARAIAIMIRAGHASDIARRVVDAQPGDDLSEWER